MWSAMAVRLPGNGAKLAAVCSALHGRVEGGEIEVFVQAGGYAANLTIRAQGKRQSVWITSKGGIRNVSITMVRS